MSTHWRIGIDLGGTKCAGVLLDPEGKEVKRLREKTPKGDYEATIRIIGLLIDTLEASANGRATVGVDMPGILDPRTRTVKNCNATWLQGRTFKDDLEAAFKRSIRVANDANCFTIAEAKDGAAKGASVVFGATLGTGCGGGIVINGVGLTGANGIAGEWGHSPIPYANGTEKRGHACFCGRKDCIEQYLSGPGLARDYNMATGKSIRAKDLPELLAQGDGEAEAALSRYEDRLARAFAAVVNIIDPDVIVLGGGVSNLERLYENVPSIMARYVFADRCVTPIIKAVHGDAAGVRGAAWLWPEDGTDV